jgi:hypothetical protein
LASLRLTPALYMNLAKKRCGTVVQKTISCCIYVPEDVQEYQKFLISSYRLAIPSRSLFTMSSSTRASKVGCFMEGYLEELF